MSFERDERIDLGCVVKDKISGFKGTVVGVTEWLNGCKRITVSADHLHEGKPIESQCFDLEQLELIKEVKEKKSNTGGDRPNVGMQATIKR